MVRAGVMVSVALHGALLACLVRRIEAPKPKPIELALVQPPHVQPLALAGGAASPSPPPRRQPPRRSSPLGLNRYYPRRALRDRIEGRTRMELAVAVDGAVTSARVVSSIPGGIFEDAALRVARQLHFAPARRGDVAIAATTQLELVWRLND